jgi:hypothetical protein
MISLKNPSMTDSAGIRLIKHTIGFLRDRIRANQSNKDHPLMTDTKGMSDPKIVPERAQKRAHLISYRYYNFQINCQFALNFAQDERSFAVSEICFLVQSEASLDRNGASINFDGQLILFRILVEKGHIWRSSLSSQRST